MLNLSCIVEVGERVNLQRMYESGFSLAWETDGYLTSCEPLFEMESWWLFKVGMFKHKRRGKIKGISCYDSNRFFMNYAPENVREGRVEEMPQKSLLLTRITNENNKTKLWLPSRHYLQKN